MTLTFHTSTARTEFVALLFTETENHNKASRKSIANRYMFNTHQDANANAKCHSKHAGETKEVDTR